MAQNCYLVTALVPICLKFPVGLDGLHLSDVRSDAGLSTKSRGSRAIAFRISDVWNLVAKI